MPLINMSNLSSSESRPVAPTYIVCEEVRMRRVLDLSGGGADIFISSGSGFGRDEGVSLGESWCEDVCAKGSFGVGGGASSLAAVAATNLNQQSLFAWLCTSQISNLFPSEFFLIL